MSSLLKNTVRNAHGGAPTPSKLNAKASKAIDSLAEKDPTEIMAAGSVITSQEGLNRLTESIGGGVDSAVTASGQMFSQFQQGLEGGIANVQEGIGDITDVAGASARRAMESIGDVTDQAGAAAQSALTSAMELKEGVQEQLGEVEAVAQVAQVAAASGALTTMSTMGGTDATLEMEDDGCCCGLCDCDCDCCDCGDCGCGLCDCDCSCSIM
ncbi:hypothetical protein AND_009322 [Anopheles darlingi]|uniref:Uncharacterized protein n=1 Tax=Anopheles darlingi TaxID=43151 RepID=W5J549_ANODA|nr:hypothetical protein AND_009322 [Anopheles darlingi]